MSTSIAPVGTYNTFTRPQVAPTAVAQAQPAYVTDSFQGGTVAQATGNPSMGKMASWAAGAGLALKFGLRFFRNPSMLVIGGVAAAGAVAGNTAYNAIKGGSAGQALGGSNVAKYAAWGGGAFAAWKYGLRFFRNPSMLVVAGVVGAGAFAGNFLYKKLTGK